MEWYGGTPALDIDNDWRTPKLLDMDDRGGRLGGVKYSISQRMNSVEKQVRLRGHPPGGRRRDILVTVQPGVVDTDWALQALLLTLLEIRREVRCGPSVAFFEAAI